MFNEPHVLQVLTIRQCGHHTTRKIISPTHTHTNAHTHNTHTHTHHTHTHTHHTHAHTHTHTHTHTQTSKTAKVDYPFGLKREAMRLLANLCYSAVLREEIGKMGGVELAMNNCHIEEHNPFLREWYCVCVCMYVCMYICMCVCVCVCVCVCMCMCEVYCYFLTFNSDIIIQIRP